MNAQKNPNESMFTRRGTLGLALMCCLGLGIFTTPSNAQSYDESSYDDVSYSSATERPVEDLFIGQTSHTRDQGDVQMSISGAQGIDGTSRSSEIKGRVEYGITNNLEARASVPMQFFDQSGSSNYTAQSSVSSFSVGTQYAILGGSDPLNLSAAFDVDIPIGSQKSVTGNNLSAGPTYKPSLIVGGNVGSTAAYADAQAELGQPTRGLNYNVGVAHAFGSVVPTMELNAMSKEDQRTQLYATPGVTYKFSDRAQAGVGAAIGLNESSKTVGVMAKFSMNLGR